MSSSSDLEKEIKVFITIEDIINAMKAYAGVTIRRTEELVLNIRRYEENILSSLADVMTKPPQKALEEQVRRKRILIVFGSSQGLCGAYNEKIADIIFDTVTGDDTLFVIGRRLRSSLELRKLKYDYFDDSVASVNGIEEALRKTTSKIMGIYKNRDYYNLAIIFTFVSRNKSDISIEQVLPPDIGGVRTLRHVGVSPLTYLERELIFNKVLEEFLYISLYRGFLESLRSENWHRLRSMEGTAESIKRRISHLGALQNYIRQEEITEEMLEILGSGMFYGR